MALKKKVTRMTHRILMGIVVMPFIVFGWLYSVWLSEQAVQAAESQPPAIVEAQ